MHGIPSRAKGTGISNCTQTVFTGCPWKIRVVYSKKDDRFVVAKFIGHHKNHSTSHNYYWSDCELTEQEQRHYIDYLFIKQKNALTSVVQELKKRKMKNMERYQFLNWVHWRHPETFDKLRLTTRSRSNEKQRNALDETSGDHASHEEHCFEEISVQDGCDDLKEDRQSVHEYGSEPQNKTLRGDEDSLDKREVKDDWTGQSSSLQSELKVEADEFGDVMYGDDEDATIESEAVGDMCHHEEQHKDDLLYVGKQYKSFESFQQDLHKYCDTTHTHVRKVVYVFHIRSEIIQGARCCTKGIGPFIRLRRWCLWCLETTLHRTA